MADPPQSDPSDQEPPAPAREDFARLEASRDKAKANAEAWKSIGLQAMAAAAGYDPTNPTVKLVVNEFAKQDLDPSNLDPKSFVEFVEPYQLPKSQPQPQPTASPTQQEPTPAPPQQPVTEAQPQQPAATSAGPMPDFAAQMAKLQQPATDLQASSVPQVQPTDSIQAAIAQAEADGDYQRAVNLKTQQAFS